MAKDGSLDRVRLEELLRTNRFQMDEYVLAGGEEEIWEPRFTYHGFQYVEVLGWPGQLTTLNFDARVVHTDFKSVGSFASSNEVLNQIQQATRWSYRTNFHSIPTDCPHREKNGWTGDAQLAVGAGLFNFDTGSSYRKWIHDLAWERYLSYASQRAVGGIADFGLGDWVPLKTRTPVAVTSTAFLFRMAELAAQAAALVGRADRSSAYSDLAKRIRTAFVERFVDSDLASVANNEQTALALTIAFKLVDPQLRKRMALRLNADVERSGFHLDTGGC